MAIPKLDDSRWPLVIVDWIGNVTVAEIDDHFDQMAALTRRGERFAVIIDMRDVVEQTAAHRRRGAERLKALADEAKKAVVCGAHVVSSSVERGVLTALYWLSPPPFETKVFTKRADAEDWAKGKLEAESPRRSG